MHPALKNAPRTAWRALAALALGLVLSASPAQATRAAPEAAGAAPHALPPGIDWFAGSVEEAFVAAQAQHRPVFLYWGAIWCPPCLELKATLFRRTDFQDRLKLFIPVYLDGDGAGAQAWGERFHVTGYPTVLVLDPNQRELERVSGGMDLARYAEVLDLALGEARTARELLAADTTGGALSVADCRQLAYNAWRLDDAWSRHPENLGELAAALERAARRCPVALQTETALLQLTALHARLAAEKAALKGGAAPSAALKAQLGQLWTLTGDRTHALAAGNLLRDLPAEAFTALLAQAPERRAQLQQRWFSLMDALAQDPRYSAADHLDALRGKLVAAKALDPSGKVPAALAAAVAGGIDASLAREHEPYARASLVNSALNVLDVLGDDDRAYAILAGEVRTSANPYYYLSDLAELEEKRGHTEQAISDFAKSFETAQGPATRFQWGVGYVRALLRLRGQDEGAVVAAARSVLAELQAAPDLHGRTRRSLALLETSLRDWNHGGAHAAALQDLRAQLQGTCAQLPAGDTARPACEGFLAGS